MGLTFKKGSKFLATRSSVSNAKGLQFEIIDIVPNRDKFNYIGRWSDWSPKTKSSFHLAELNMMVDVFGFVPVEVEVEEDLLWD